jgi:hypothetical protein
MAFYKENARFVLFSGILQRKCQICFLQLTSHIVNPDSDCNRTRTTFVSLSDLLAIFRIVFKISKIIFMIWKGEKIEKEKLKSKLTCKINKMPTRGNTPKVWRVKEVNTQGMMNFQTQQTYVQRHVTIV